MPDRRMVTPPNTPPEPIDPSDAKPATVDDAEKLRATGRAVLEPDTEKSLSAERSRYLLIGSSKAVNTFCVAKFGKPIDELPNVEAVTRSSDVARLRADRSWMQRGTGYRAPVLMFLPRWSREEGLLNESLLYELAMLDDGRES